MPLINCPTCNKEISADADACPECGHPMKKNRVHAEPVVTNENREEPFPKWIIAPLVVFGAVLLFGLIYAFQNNDTTANENINVDIEGDRAATERRADIPPATTDTATIPDTSTTEIREPENNQTIGADTKTEVIDTKSDKGSVEINAKVSNKKGDVSSVKDEKFYLLDKELGQILQDANLKPINNQNLVNSFGLSVLDPNKHKEFNEKALAAINDHIKYDTLTDSNGSAKISDVKPDSYYLFGIHKVGNGFAVWSSPVSIKEGQNNLNIQPQRMQEIK